MQDIKRKTINWANTAKNLKLLRNDNISLRRYVCHALGKMRCEGKCECCKFDMDLYISQNELAEAFNVSESRIVNWETGRSKPAIEDLLFYSQICGIGLENVLVFDE